MIDFRLMTISNFMITRVWCFIFFLFCKLVYEVSANIAPLFYIRTPCYSMSSAFSLPYHPMLNYIVWQDMMIEDFACQVISRNFYYLFSCFWSLTLSKKYHIIHYMKHDKAKTYSYMILNFEEHICVSLYEMLLYCCHVTPNSIHFTHSFIDVIKTFIYVWYF